MKRALFFTTLSAFLLYAAFGLGFCINMDGNMQGMKGSTHQTSMNSSSPVCQMSVIVHLTRWQQTFGAVFNQIGSTLALLTVVFVALTFRLTQLTNAPPFVRVFEQYWNDHPGLKLFNPILLAISNGILQPKLYI